MSTPTAQKTVDHFPWDVLIPLLPQLIVLLLLAIILLMLGRRPAPDWAVGLTNRPDEPLRKAGGGED